LTVEVRPVTLDRGVVILHRALFSLRGRQIWVPSCNMQTKVNQRYALYLAEESHGEQRSKRIYIM
jgi:hypothetical protein